MSLTLPNGETFHELMAACANAGGGADLQRCIEAFKGLLALRGHPTHIKFTQVLRAARLCRVAPDGLGGEVAEEEVEEEQDAEVVQEPEDEVEVVEEQAQGVEVVQEQEQAPEEQLQEQEKEPEQEDEEVEGDMEVTAQHQHEPKQEQQEQEQDPSAGLPVEHIWAYAEAALKAGLAMGARVQRHDVEELRKLIVHLQVWSTHPPHQATSPPHPHPMHRRHCR